MLLSTVKKKYNQKAKIAGSLFLLKPEDAIGYIDECVAAGLHLCGVDGFSITPQGAYLPHQEHSNDIAETTLDYDGFVKETKQFIVERKEMGLWFEVVFSKST